MTNLTNIKERISYYIGIKNITTSEFHKQTGVSYGILWQKSKMSEDNIVKILTTYRDININWLLLGEGPMLKADTKEGVEETKIIEKISDLIQKNSENLIAEIKNLGKRAKPQPYPEPPIPLNLVAEEEIKEFELKGKKNRL